MMVAVAPREPSELVDRGQLQRHHEGVAQIGVAPVTLFDHLDDQERFAEHMRRPSAMMGGGRMTYQFDAGRGRSVGSHIRMGGAAFGIALFVDEIVTLREPPLRKIWRTTGAPRLLVIGQYEMGFECLPQGPGTRLRVWIDYDLPASFIGKLFGSVLATFYARWCVQRILKDAVHFVRQANGK